MGSEKSAIPESEGEVYSEPGEYSRAETEEEASDSPGYEDYPSVEPEDRQFLLEDSEFEEPVPGPLIRLGRRIDGCIEVQRSVREVCQSEKEKRWLY